jgi:hypothetical protein
MPRVNYSAESVHGKLLAEAVNALIRGRETLDRVIAAADVASNAGTDTAKLEGGDFGAAIGEGQAYWDTTASIKGLLDAQDPAGLAQFLSSVDQGG